MTRADFGSDLVLASLMQTVRVPNLSHVERCFLQTLKDAGVPIVAIRLCALVFGAGLVSGHSGIDAVEFFSGAAAVSRGLQQRGYLAYPYEVKEDGVLHDIMSTDGYIHALAVLLRIRPAGLVWFSHMPPRQDVILEYM
jgi:hypothetical protein